MQSRVSEKWYDFTVEFITFREFKVIFYLKF